MLSFKMVFGSILIATVGDLLASKFYPQLGSSRFGWTFNQVKGNLMKLQNVTHKLADVFCNNPDECKNATDEFFAIVAHIPQDFLAKIEEFVKRFASPSEQRPQDDGAVKKNHRAAKIHAANYSTDEVQLKGDATKAEAVIKSLRFSSYEENNLCDLKEGIPPAEYDDTVDEIADLTSMPAKLRKVIKRAKNFTGGNVLAVNRLQFKTEDGNMVFGRVAVIRRGEVLDMAYSLHSVEYELMSKQRQRDNAEKLEQFSGSLGDGIDKIEGFEGISFELREDFLAFFHKQAIRGFVQHCDFVLKTLKEEDRDAEVLQQIGITSGRVDEAGDKAN